MTWSLHLFRPLTVTTVETVSLNNPRRSEPLETKTLFFNVHGSVHRNNILIYIQQDATLHSLFYLETALHVSGWYHHPSSGAQTTVSTASGICHTVTATCRHRGRVGTGLSVLWVAYAVTVWQIPDAVDTVVCAPDDGWRYHPTCRAVSGWNKLCNVASCWTYIRIFLRCTDPWTLNTMECLPSRPFPTCNWIFFFT